MNDIYCTYFDHNYLTRALLTIRSLRRYDSETPIYILALSELCETVLRELDLLNIEIIPLATLEKAYSELGEIKATRRTIEYYFTLTPFLPHYLFNVTKADRITYIDADLYFFSSPKPVLQSLRDASVAITPHRFSYQYMRHAMYGLFNVAWITYRRCPEGLECLNKYKDDCTAWCFDRLEGDRFGDQKYLDSWPGRYPSLKIIEHKGVNLAAWNLDNYTVRMKKKIPMIDDDPLVFFHFTGTSLGPDNGLQVYVPPPPNPSKEVLIRHVINPYIEKYRILQSSLRQRFAALEMNEGGIRYNQELGA
jgi:hypothetical protein